MAKISRITQKIFGSGAGFHQIGKFGSLFAGGALYTTDAEEAMSLSNWITGWYGALIGGNAPAAQDLNAVPFVVTTQLAYLFQAGIPEWDTGTTYYIGSFASDGAGRVYFSLTDDNLGNALSDTANWKLSLGEPTGSGKDFWGATKPDGYVWASGKTIGNASSNGTERANADTFDLFSMFWTDFSATNLPIYTSAGVLSVRGASAAADFAANKAISVPDKRGRVSAGKDNLGGTAANRLTTGGASIDGTALGAAGGEQTHVLITAEIPSHNHTQNSHTHVYDRLESVGAGGNVSISVGTSWRYTAAQATGAATPTNNATGGDGAHQNTQPTIVCNYIIKL